jgi:hypothetical protein
MSAPAPALGLAGGGLVSSLSLQSSQPLGHYSFDMTTNHGILQGRMTPDETVHNVRVASLAQQSVRTAKSPGWRG